MIRPLATIALLALASASSLPQAAPLAAKTLRTADDIRWNYGGGGQEGLRQSQLQFSRDGDHGNFGTGDAAELMGEEAIAALASPGAAIAFTVAREAGTLACTGSVAAPQRAGGTCRFMPDATFAQRLASKGLSPSSSEELLGATLVDARLAQVEELEREGYRFDEFGDVIAVAALEVTAGFAASLRASGLQFADLDNLVGAKAVGVTPEYVASLRGAGLAFGDEDDVVAARAVGVDPDWIAGMARVGYDGLSLDQAVQLRSMDVTPEYAARMTRVMAAVGE